MLLLPACLLSTVMYKHLAGHMNMIHQQQATFFHCSMVQFWCSHAHCRCWVVDRGQHGHSKWSTGPQKAVMQIRYSFSKIEGTIFKKKKKKLSCLDPKPHLFCRHLCTKELQGAMLFYINLADSLHCNQHPFWSSALGVLLSLCDLPVCSRTVCPSWPHFKYG